MRRSQMIMVGAVVIVGVGGSLFAWRWQQRGPDRASVPDAIDRFRTSSTLASPAGPLVPAAGVYVYGGSGTETLSFLDTRQTQGPTEPATVVRRPNGCWQFRIDFNSFHYQTWDRCSTRTTITESGGSADQQFDFAAFTQHEHSETVCDPPMVVADLTAAPGATRPIHCTGRGQTTKTTFTQTGTATLLGLERVTVGSQQLPALHTRERMRLGGGESGEVNVDIWFAVADGLPLKEVHAIRVESPAPAPINHVTYLEEGTWQLTSLSPRT